MKSKSAVLIAIAVLSFISGAVVQYLNRAGSPMEFVFLGLAAFLIFYWYHIDTEERGYRRTSLLNISVIALAVVALPYYFFRSRGTKGGFVAVGFFVLAFVGAGILTVAGQYATYYVQLLQR
jgi:hypothetical protein